MIKQFMPKNATIKIVVMAVAVLFIGACKKNETASKMANSFQPLEGAKLNGLKKSYGQDQNIVLNNNNWLNTLSPDWKKVNEQKLEKGSVYEIMLNNPQGIFATDGKVDLKDAKKKYANKSSIRLLIFQDGQGQNYRSCFMEVIATGESELPTQLSYKNYGNLNGLVSFYELDGKLANGWVYSNGKAVMSTAVNGMQTRSLSSSTAKSGGNGRIMFEDGPPEGYIDCGNRLVAHTRTVCTEVGGLEGPGYDGGGEGSGKICNDQMYFVSERIYCPIPGADGDGTYNPPPTTTPPPNGAGDPDPSINWGLPSDVLISTKEVDEESDEPTTKKRTKWYTWQFHDGGGFKLFSYEKSKIKKEGDDPWKFTSFSHLSAWPEGKMSTGEDVQVITIDADIAMGSLETTVNLLYQVKHTQTNSSNTGSAPKYSKSFSASKRFNPSMQGTVLEN